MTTLHVELEPVTEAIKKQITIEIEKHRQRLIDEAVKEFRDKLTTTLAKAAIEVANVMHCYQFAQEFRIVVDTTKYKEKENDIRKSTIDR